MTAYYNEFDPFAAQWLRNLIDANLIAPGIVDDRSITDVTTSDLKGFTQCHFFAGIGGWSFALRLAGIPDNEPCWTASAPCQPYSLAGKQLAQSDERHLAPVFVELVRQCRPAKIFGEQVSAAVGKQWLDDLFDDLEAEGYACGASVLPACSVGAPHKRNRLVFGAVANSNSQFIHVPGMQREGGRVESPDSCTAFALGHANNQGSQVRGSGFISLPDQEGWEAEKRSAGLSGFWAGAEAVTCWDGKSRNFESGSFPLVNGIPKGMGRGKSSPATLAGRNRVGRLRGYGNAVLPQKVAIFIEAFNAAVSEAFE